MTSSHRTLTTPPSAPKPPGGPDRPSWAALVVLLIGGFMTILDFFIVNVTIPVLQQDLHATPAQVQFVIAGYGLAYAVLLITAGRLGDVLGRRRMFAIGLSGFTLASLACGLAPTPDALIAARAVQGAAAAMAFPQVLSILSVTYTARARATAFTAFGVMLGVASISGQLLGGLLIAADIAGLSWRACFLINIPIGVLTLLLIRPFIAESRSEQARRVDLTGVALSALGLVLLVYPLVAGRQADWPWWAFVCIAAAPIVLVVFVAQQRRLADRGGSPLLELSLFRERPFLVGLLIVLTFYASTQSIFLVIAVFIQDGRGLGPLAAGVTFLPLGVGYFLTSLAATRLCKRLGRQALAIGAVVMAASYVVLWLTAGAGEHTSGWPLLPGLAVNGLGMGMVMGPLIAQVLDRNTQ